MVERQILLEMRNITKVFPGVKALDGVSLRIQQAEVHGICGENGAGKSTLMKVLSGVYPYGSYSGDIILGGQEQRFSDIRSSEKAGVAIIHQELALIPELSIMENMFLGNEVAKNGVINWAKAQRTARELLALVGLEEDPMTPIKNIGIGKQQLVEIAKALHKNARILIFDEPTAALNEKDSENMLELIRGLRERGITCIIISHKLEEVLSIAENITILRDGKTVAYYPVDDTLTAETLIRGMVGRSLDSRFPDYSPNIGQPFFEVKNWTVRHPEIPDAYVCRNESFFVRRGEIVGFAGLMGAGRTELARSLFGRTYGIYESGDIYIDGKLVQIRSVADAIKHGLAYVTEDRKALGLNLLDDIKRTTVSAALRRVTTDRILDPSKEFRAAEDYRRSMRIKAKDVNVGTSTLSGGNQQKVVLAKWLFTQPDLLILDEPTRGIDVGAKFEIYGIIQQLASQGKGVMLISSELPELLGLCDRIYTISKGGITGCLDKFSATQENLMTHMTMRVPTAATSKDN